MHRNRLGTAPDMDEDCASEDEHLDWKSSLGVLAGNCLVNHGEFEDLRPLSLQERLAKGGISKSVSWLGCTTL